MAKRKPLPPRAGGDPDDGRRRRPRRPSDRPPTTASGALWLYGTHAVLAACANPARRLQRLLATPEAARRHGEALAAGPESPRLEILARAEIERVLPDGAVHQGLAALAAPLPDRDIEEILARCGADERAAGPARPRSTTGISGRDSSPRAAVGAPGVSLAGEAMRYT